MALAHWDPFRELEDMSERLNRVFGRSLARRGEGRDPIAAFDWAPTVDIAETAGEFQIKAELPEVKKEDVKVSVDAGVLRISGERKQEKEEKDKRWHRVERSYGSFLRSFALPDGVDEARVAAEFKDGILLVRLPKAENPKPKSVDIKIG
ncbi:MAG: Hsp20/alpha crystallin family protein [Polyangiaceae bacterium]|nr:Hsp20/alpha crystallin family protein [Polyangiaceae bacterium]